VAEIGLMLRIARETSLVGTLDPFACRLADDPSLQCLDIGAPSTLGGFVHWVNDGRAGRNSASHECQYHQTEEHCGKPHQ